MKNFGFAVLFVCLAAGSAPAQHGTASDPGLAQAIVALDVPTTFEAAARKLGYTSIKPVKLDALQLTGYRVIVPAGIDADRAIQALRSLFPAAMVELDSGFELSSGSPD